MQETGEIHHAFFLHFAVNLKFAKAKANAFPEFDKIPMLTTKICHQQTRAEFNNLCSSIL